MLVYTGLEEHRFRSRMVRLGLFGPGSGLSADIMTASPHACTQRREFYREREAHLMSQQSVTDNHLSHSPSTRRYEDGHWAMRVEKPPEWGAVVSYLILVKVCLHRELIWL